MSNIILATIVIVLLFGCGEQKVDAEKLNHANALVNTGHFDEGIQQLDELAKASPSDVALKQSLVSAHMKYAHFFMYNDTLAPRVKYPSALKHYRAVLQYDPNNKDAQENANQIIEIYKMMGREVPSV